MFTILILEDDPVQNLNLKKILTCAYPEFKILQAHEIDEALELSNNFSIDLFFIDIDLGGPSGLDFANSLRASEEHKLTWIIFTTTFADHMLNAFKEIHCYDYILKPYKKENILELTHTISTSGKNNKIPEPEDRKYIFVDIKNIKLKLFLDEIYFIEVYFRKCIIHTKHGQYQIDRLTLKQIKDSVTDYPLLQSHRSYLVNINHIKELNISPDNSSSIIHFTDYSETALLGKNFKKSILLQFKM